jgi:hypothetical protein
MVITESTYSNMSSKKGHEEVCDVTIQGDRSIEVITVFAAAMCQLHREEFPSRMSIIQKSKIVASACSLKKLVEEPDAIRSFSAVKAVPFRQCEVLMEHC